jgi:hypothetical protein
MLWSWTVHGHQPGQPPVAAGSAGPGRAEAQAAAASVLLRGRGFVALVAAHPHRRPAWVGLRNTSGGVTWLPVGRSPA